MEKPILNFWQPVSLSWADNNQVKTTVQWRWASTLFSDEQEKMNQMLELWLDEKRAKEVITINRKKLLKNISKEEGTTLRQMAADWLDTNTAVEVIKKIRYKNLPLWKKAVKIPFDASVWASSLATEQVWNLLDFTTGGKVPYFKEQVEWVKEVTDRSFKWETWFQSGRNILWAWEVLAVTPTKIASTLWGRALQAWAIWAWIWWIDPILEKGSDATAWDILWWAAIWWALWAASVPLLEKLAIPALWWVIKKIRWVTKAVWKEWVKKVIKQTFTKTWKNTALDILKPEKLSAKQLSKLKLEWKVKTWKWLTWENWEYVPDKRDLEIAKDSSDYLVKWKSTSENIINVRKWIADLWEKTKQEIIKQWDSIFNTKTINSKFKNIEKPVLIKSDASLNNAYDNVIKKVQDLIKKSPKQKSSLLQVRKDFDKFVNREFPNLYSSDTLTPMKTAILDVREVLNDFIASWLPKWNSFRELLKKQSNLYRAMDMLSDKTDITWIGKIIKNPFVKAWIWAWVVWTWLSTF